MTKTEILLNVHSIKCTMPEVYETIKEIGKDELLTEGLDALEEQENIMQAEMNDMPVNVELQETN